jgi:hypothetical protein
MLIRFPDPEYEAAFRAYLNYFEDLAGSIGGRYGFAPSLAIGVHDAIAAHPPVRRVQRRRPSAAETKAMEAAFRKSWSALRRIDREVEDPTTYDEEANAWLPMQAYYSVFHAIIGFAVASGQPVPRDHASALKLAGKEVTRGSLPQPWDAWCGGCPQTGQTQFGGVNLTGPVHVLSTPDPWTSEDRLAMFLRTTRQKELERRFAQERQKGTAKGRTRRNLSKADKERLAAAMAPTTVFDVLWRLRKKANYEDADTFVLGAAGELDARRLGQSLVIVTDATISALEGLSAAYVGAEPLADMSAAYAQKTSSAPTSVVGRHAASWSSRRRVRVGP